MTALAPAQQPVTVLYLAREMRRSVIEVSAAVTRLAKAWGPERVVDAEDTLSGSRILPAAAAVIRQEFGQSRTGRRAK